MIRVQNDDVILEGDLIQLMTDCSMVVGAVYGKLAEEKGKEFAEAFVVNGLPYAVLPPKGDD